MTNNRINEAEVIALAERIAKAKARIKHAEFMLNVCSEFAVEQWQELLDDSREFLAELEALDKPAKLL